jgi:hypothetical protein
MKKIFALVCFILLTRWSLATNIAMACIHIPVPFTPLTFTSRLLSTISSRWILIWWIGSICAGIVLLYVYFKRKEDLIYQKSFSRVNKILLVFVIVFIISITIFMSVSSIPYFDTQWDGLDISPHRVFYLLFWNQSEQIPDVRMNC